MKITQRHGKPAFTLIELMAVITIIVILAGLVVGGLGFVTERQAKEKARVQLALLGKGLESYKLDMGVYPASSNAEGLTQSNKCLYQALFYEGYDYNKQTNPPTNWTKATTIYVSDLDPTSSKQGWVPTVTGTPPVIPATSVVSDPWGNEYRYRSGKLASGAVNSSAVNPDFDLWSIGKDAKTNSTPTHKDVRDDIKNF
jgi:prepilin-type N-terminal cleavage/methylation domain-containing protein